MITYGGCGYIIWGGGYRFGGEGYRSGEPGGGLGACPQENEGFGACPKILVSILTLSHPEKKKRRCW